MVNYSRLVMFSFGFQHAVQRGLRREDVFFQRVSCCVFIFFVIPEPLWSVSMLRARSSLLWSTDLLPPVMYAILQMVRRLFLLILLWEY